LVVTWAFEIWANDVVGGEYIAAFGIDNHTRARCLDFFFELLGKIKKLPKDGIAIERIVLFDEGVVSFTTGARVGIWPPLTSGTCATTGVPAIYAQRSTAHANRRSIFAKLFDM
jgi:hypothetical protein